jgi:NAD(P)H-hydrate epimerase
MYVLKAQQMRDADAMASEKYGISGIVLMENAARAVYDYIIQKKYNSVVIVCGGGNNGGDGFALSRLLSTIGCRVRVFCFADKTKIKGDAAENLSILDKMDINVESSLEELKSAIVQCQAVVDAIFGTGFRGEILGDYKEAIEIINNSSKDVISIDIPSGIFSDTGKESNVYIKADCTITFCCKKSGLIMGTGRQASGLVLVRGISMPEGCILSQKPYITTNDESYPARLIKKRRIESHKGDYGRVYIVSGSYNMSGAAALCAKAALRTGSGLVTCVVPECIMDRVGSIVPEATFLSFDDKECRECMYEEALKQICNTADAVAFGPGMGTGEKTVEMLKGLLDNFKGKLVIDADGINILSEHKELLKKMTPNIILTPHPGEMSKLTGLAVKEINSERIGVARSFARDYGCTVVLKGASTVVSNGKESYINTSGNPGMATGGSGDVLTGMISSLCGQGYEPWDASVLGCYLHGCAGDAAMEQYGYGLTAGDLPDFISRIKL